MKKIASKFNLKWATCLLVSFTFVGMMCSCECLDPHHHHHHHHGPGGPGGPGGPHHHDGYHHGGPMAQAQSSHYEVL